jgi:hypothetical protein
VVDVGGDAADPRANGDEDEVRRKATSPMMPATTSIVFLRVARVWLEGAGAAGVYLKFREDGRRTAARFWPRR